MRSTITVRAIAAAIVGAFVFFAGAAVPVAAVEPIDLRDARLEAPRTAPPVHVPDRPPAEIPLPEAAPESTATVPSPTAARPSPTVVPSPTATAPEGDSIGYDISYPQCGDEYPDAFAFAIVGVNGGRVHSANPCLGTDRTDEGQPSQLAWAGPDADLYVNTGNPGPRISRHWPRGQDEPVPCDTRDDRGDDTLDCAYVYGWNAAEDSYEIALEAFREVGWVDEDADEIPGERTWWLDVETANSWRTDRRLNVAALRGAVDYLGSRGVEEIGFYSTPLLWYRITGGTDAFADHPAWLAGATGLEDALSRCGQVGFTGGELRMVQWVEDGLDHNVRCP